MELVPVPGGPLTPLVLRVTAEWLDLADKAFTLLDSHYVGATTIQDDLKRWADELEEGRLVTALKGPTE